MTDIDYEKLQRDAEQAVRAWKELAVPAWRLKEDKDEERRKKGEAAREALLEAFRPLENGDFGRARLLIKAVVTMEMAVRLDLMKDPDFERLYFKIRAWMKETNRQS